MTGPEIFRLSESERQSALWRRLRPWLVSERSDRLEQLAGDMPEAKTQMLRGEIAAFTAILGKDTPRLNVSEDDTAMV